MGRLQRTGRERAASLGRTILTPRPINKAHRPPKRAIRGTALTQPRDRTPSVSTSLLSSTPKCGSVVVSIRQTPNGVMIRGLFSTVPSKGTHVSGRPRHKHARVR